MVLLGLSNVGAQPAESPNIVFIAVDDLNCDFGAYGNRMVKSPNLDEIAEEGVIFTNNHCQKAVCGPSRASLLSGFTPEHTGITGFYQYLRDMYPNVLTLPQFFKNKGYTTIGMGKIHDFRNVSETDNVDLVSWTKWLNIYGKQYVNSTGKPATEMADVADNVYTDGKLGDAALAQIDLLVESDAPFFLAVGFKKPHLPFVAPTKYWNLYDRDSISLAPFRKYAQDDREFVHNPGAEFRNGYDDVPQEGTFSHDLQRKYIHGYYACVSYVDTQIGKIKEALVEKGLYENTIIVIWGDHGFSLGDHTNWGKHTNFDYATRCPLIIRTPGGRAGYKCASPTELLDIYPTLVDLAGYAVPDTLDGISLVPILDGTRDRVKSFSVSQYWRGGSNGFALRSDYYQFVEWQSNNVVTHRQLFNFAADPYQTKNLYLLPEYHEMIDTFSFRLNNYRLHGENTAPVNITDQTDSLGLYRKDELLEFIVFGSEPDEIAPLKEAAVSIGQLELPTSGKGYAALNLQPLVYTYKIEKENYSSVTGILNLSKDTIVRDTLVRKGYRYSLQVSDHTTGSFLEDIPVIVGDSAKTTGPDGSITMNLVPGVHNILIESAGYEALEMSFELYSDSVMQTDLVRSNVDLVLKLTSNGTPVENANVDINGILSETSDITGTAQFLDLTALQEYGYHASKDGYIPVWDTVFLLKDTIIQLALEPQLFDISFIVREKNSGQAFSNVAVSFDDLVKYSGLEGEVLFSDFPAGLYAASAETENYEIWTSIVDVQRDTSIVITMSLTGEETRIVPVAMQIQPNPSKASCRIEYSGPVSEIWIVKSSGERVVHYGKVSRDTVLQAENLQPGLYFIYMQTEHCRWVKKLIITG